MQIRRLLLLLVGFGGGVATGAEVGGEFKSGPQSGMLDVRLTAQPGGRFLVDRTSGRLAHLGLLLTSLAIVGAAVI